MEHSISRRSSGIDSDQKRKNDKQRIFEKTSRDCGVADIDRKQCDGSRHTGENRRGELADGGSHGDVSDPKCEGLERLRRIAGKSAESKPRNSDCASIPPWQRSAFIYCRDNKIRRVPAESILLGVADGVSDGVDGIRVAGISEAGGFPLTTQKEGRAMILKGYGNAIVPQVAAEFIKAFMAEME